MVPTRRARFAILGGPGIDPQEFQALSPPANAVPVAACVGRHDQARNGIDVLFQACDRVAARGMPLALHLYGQRDATDPDAIDGPDLDAAVARCGRRSGTDRLPTRTPSGAAPTSACCPPGTAAACRARCWRRPPARARCS